MIRSTADFGGGDVSGGGEEDIFFAKFDGDGSHLWSKAFGSNTNGDRGMGVAIDGSGDPVFTGTFVSEVDFGGGALSAAFAVWDVFLVQFDSAGNHLWSDSYQSSKGDTPYGLDTFACQVGLTGEFVGDEIDFGGGVISNNGSVSPDIFLAKLHAGGLFCDDLEDGLPDSWSDVVQ